MRKFLLFATFAFIIYSLSVSAAASVSQLSNIHLGSTGLGIEATREFTLTNNGDVALSNIRFAFSSSQITTEFNKTNFNLAVGQSEVISLNLTIPESFSTGNITLGSVNMTSTQLNTLLFSVSAEVTKGLLIEDLDIFLTTRPMRGSNGLVETKSADDLDVQDGDKIDFDDEEAGPGSEIRFKFNIENTFSESDDVDIEDVTVTLTIDGIDDGDDIDEEFSNLDIDSGKSGEADLYVNIPMSVEEGTYDLLVEIEGEDTNGNVHTEEMDLELSIVKEPRDVIVAEASLFPVKITCSGTATLTATIKNLGKRPEEDAQLGISNSDLGISFIEKNIELEAEPFDGNDEFTKNLPVIISKGTNAGNYPIKVSAYIQENVVWDERTVNLEVGACSDAAAEEPVQEEPAEEVVEEVPETTEEQPEEETEGTSVPVLEPETTTELPLTKRPIFWIVLALVNLLVIGAIAFAAAGLAKKP